MKVFGLETNFEEFGQGDDAVLFLHGWGCDVTDFLGTAKTVSGKFKTICLDLWGFGKSEQPKDVWGTEDYANAVVQFLKQKNLKLVHLVGHSFGGKIAAKIAADNFNLSKSLVLVSSAGILKKSLKTKLLILRYKHLKKLVLKGKKPKSVLKRFGSNDWKQTSGIMKKIMGKVTNENFAGEFKKIKVPTLIVWGKNDTTTPVFMAKKIYKKVNGSKLKIFEGNHFVHIQNFAQFNKICLEFWGSLC